MFALNTFKEMLLDKVFLQGDDRGRQIIKSECFLFSSFLFFKSTSEAFFLKYFEDETYRVNLS